MGEECISEVELRNLLDKKKDPVCYDGFEPSGTSRRHRHCDTCAEERATSDSVWLTLVGAVLLQAACTSHRA